MEVPELFGRTNLPKDCALLVAPPLDLESFRGDVEMARPSVPARLARGDYAHQMVKALPTPSVDKAWDKDGQAVASLCRKLIADAVSVGVNVYVDASRDRLTKVTRDNAAVIVIVAHWRGSRVAASDLRIHELENAMRAAQSSSDPFAWRIYERLDSIVSESGLETRASVLADAISVEICREAGYPDPRPDDGFMNGPERSTTIGQVRDRADALFPDFLVPGHCLEFRDGYHKAHVVAEMFDPGWSGVVELAVCHSIHLAERIKSGREDRRIFTNEMGKHPERCIPELRVTFLRLSKGEESYIHLRFEVFKEFSRILLSS